MRTSILVIHKPGAAECKLGAPDAIRQEFRRYAIEGVSGAERIELWESGSGIVRRHKFQPESVNNETNEATEPAKRGPGRPKKQLA